MDEDPGRARMVEDHKAGRGMGCCHTWATGDQRDMVSPVRVLQEQVLQAHLGQTDGRTLK